MRMIPSIGCWLTAWLLAMSHLISLGQEAQTFRYDFGSMTPARLSESDCVSLRAGSLGLRPDCRGQVITLRPQAITLGARAHFISLAVHWATDGLAHGVGLSYRWADSLGIWQPWQPLRPDGHATRTDDDASSELVFLDRSADQVQLKLTFHDQSARVEALGLRLFAPGQVRPRRDGTVRADAIDSSCLRPTFVSQAEWRCPPCAETPSMPPAYNPTSHLVIHHTATNPQPPYDAHVLSIWDFHVNGNGWDDIGYNWLIAPDGTLYEGRAGGNHAQGAHMCGRNGFTMAVAMIGNFTTTTPTDEALATLRELLSWRATLLGLDPFDSAFHAPANGVLPNILGHRDGCNPGYTECPGDAFYPMLAEVRDSVQADMMACTVAPLSDGDLIITQRSLTPATVAPSDSLVAAYTQYLSHNVEITHSTVLGVLLSTDCRLDASDILLALDTALVTSDGSSLSGEVTLAIPANTALGAYNLLFVADYPDSLAESDERNNLVCRALSVGTTSSLAPAQAENQLQVFPNPFAHTVTLQWQAPWAGTLRWRLTDMLGRQAAAGTLPGGQAKLTLPLPEALAPGVYHLHLQGAAETAVRTLIKAGR